MIRFENVTKSFEHKVIDDLSFEIKNGERFGIFGISGIGKTTLINLILGLEKEDLGNIYKDFSKASVIFQEDRLIDEISAFDNLKIVNDNARLIEETLGILNIVDLKTPIAKFSGGMKRRVAIARVLVFDGDILIMDEPFAGIDEENKNIAIDLIKRRFSGKTIILVSHDKDDMAKFDIPLENVLYL